MKNTGKFGIFQRKTNGNWLVRLLQNKPVTHTRAVRPCLTVGELHPLTPPPKDRSGWVRNKVVDCPFYLGFWICAVCIRSGRDFRREFCPTKTGAGLAGAEVAPCLGATHEAPLSRKLEQTNGV